MAHVSPQDTLAARREFEKSAAEALAGLAHVLMLDYLRSWNNPTKENIRLAEEALERAYSMHGSVVPLAHVAESKIREVKGDLKSSIESLDVALKLDPGLADAYAHKANAHILLGEAEKAPPLLEDAIKRRSDDSELGLFHWFMGRAYFHMKDYDTAIDWLKKSVEERPTTWVSWAHLISAYALTERLGEPDAKAALDAYRERFIADWPLDNIKAYYDQPKYRTAPQLQAALEEYFTGLEAALSELPGNRKPMRLPPPPPPK